jgi:two-component sensor histidine kinase
MNVGNTGLGLLLGFSMALSYQSFGQYDWLPTSKSNAPDTVKTWTLRQIGDSLVTKGQLSNARQAYQQALTMAQRMGVPKEIGMGYRSLGYWQEQVGDYPQAIALYQQALTEFKKGNNLRQIARTMNFISFSYDRLHEDKLAIQYAESGLKLAQQGNMPDIVVQFYEKLAQLASHRKDRKLVDDYTGKVLAYYKDKKDWLSYYTALYNSALTDKNGGLYQRSEEKFRQVEAYATKQKDDYFLGYIWASIPYALIPLNKLDEAEQYCRLALRQTEKSGVDKHSLLTDVNEHLKRIAEKRGDYKQALLYYERQIANRDSVFNEAKSRQLTELETRYQTQLKEDDIRQLAATNAMQTRQIWAGMGGLLILVLLLGTLFWFYTRVRQSRQRIQQQSDQMALIMKELHHRVKNNLAIVSSLLKLQSNRLDDEKAVQAVRVGQQRVEAMSLIHQRLYQVDEVTTVNMQEYLTDLTESLMRAYGYHPDFFDLQLTVEHPKLDVDVAMPLGLIVNELATNAFKYAYAEATRPSLRIALLNQKPKSGIMLEVHDNGPGIDMSDWQQTDRRSSFGKRLIVSLSEQLEGQFGFYKQNGTLFRLHIPEVRLQA